MPNQMSTEKIIQMAKAKHNKIVRCKVSVQANQLHKVSLERAKLETWPQVLIQWCRINLAIKSMRSVINNNKRELRYLNLHVNYLWHLRKITKLLSNKQLYSLHIISNRHCLQLKDVPVKDHFKRVLNKVRHFQYWVYFYL